MSMEFLASHKQSIANFPSDDVLNGHKLNHRRSGFCSILEISKNFIHELFAYLRLWTNG